MFIVNNSSKGANGQDGADGQGFLFRGTWSSHPIGYYNYYDLVSYDPSNNQGQGGIGGINPIGGPGGNNNLSVTNLYLLTATDNGVAPGATGSCWTLFIPGGAAGADGTDGSGFQWRGAWSDMQSYVDNDVCSYQSNIYIKDQQVVNQIPPLTPDQPNSGFSLYLPKGIDGNTTLDNYTLTFAKKEAIVNSIVNNNRSLTISVTNPTTFQKRALWPSIDTAAGFHSACVVTVYADYMEFFCEDGNWTGTPPIADDIIFSLYEQGSDELIITHNLNSQSLLILLWADTTNSGFLTRRTNDEALIYQQTQNLSTPFALPISFYKAKIVILNSNILTEFAGLPPQM